MNDIKAHIKSVESTRQITKAMELVATSKLRRAKEKAERSRPYFEILRSAIDRLEEFSEAGDSIWTKPEKEKALYIVIAGDRGLAGGYNSNIFRLASSEMKDGDAVLPIGKKAQEYYRHRGYEIFDSTYEYADDVSVGRAFDIAEEVSSAYLRAEFGKVVLIYTKFASMLSQIASSEQLLPLTPEKTTNESDMIFEGDPEEMLQKIIPQYIGGIITAATAEALASESAARRTAMSSANKNADEMISSLMLSYNRARQAVITQEITEIVSGAEAL